MCVRNSLVFIWCKVLLYETSSQMIFYFVPFFYWKSKIWWFDDIKLILQPFFISANTIKEYFYEFCHMTSLSVTFSQPLGAIKRIAFISFKENWFWPHCSTKSLIHKVIYIFQILTPHNHQLYLSLKTKNLTLYLLTRATAWWPCSDQATWSKDARISWTIG